jgi:small subunit ribosomal protein S20
VALRHKSAVKRAKQSEKKRHTNKAAMSTLKTLVKKVITSAEGKESQDAKENLRLATACIDKAAGKGLIHKNKAGRLVSRLTSRVNSSANR